MIEVNTQ